MHKHTNVITNTFSNPQNNSTSICDATFILNCDLFVYTFCDRAAVWITLKLQTSPHTNANWQYEANAPSKPPYSVFSSSHMHRCNFYELDMLVSFSALCKDAVTCWDYGMNAQARGPSGIILTRWNRTIRRKTCPSATLSTTNPTHTRLRLKPGLCSHKVTTNNPCRTTARHTCTQRHTTACITSQCYPFKHHQESKLLTIPAMYV